MIQFSIRTLLIVTAYVAVLTILAVSFGPGPPMAVTVSTALAACCYQAHRSNKAVYFYMCFVAMAILLTMPLHYPIRYLSDTDVIAYCIFIGLGAWMSLAAIRRGHWCTKILGIFVFTSYILGVIEILLRNAHFMK